MEHTQEFAVCKRWADKAPNRCIIDLGPDATGVRYGLRDAHLVMEGETVAYRSPQPDRAMEHTDHLGRPLVDPTVLVTDENVLETMQAVRAYFQAFGPSRNKLAAEEMDTAICRLLDRTPHYPRRRSARECRAMKRPRLTKDEITILLHTPGPWRITNEGLNDDGCYRHQIGTPEKTVAYTWRPNEFNDDENVANAALIAAAPDLLAALQAIDAEGTDINENGDIVVPSHIWDMVSRAIIKATGA